MILRSTTRLNKLKFNTQVGGDRWSGGKSGQPYITKRIPGVEYNNSNQTFVSQLDDSPLQSSGVDSLLRGGIVGALDAASNDVSRLSKMLFDTKSPNGFEFIAKQNVLSRNNVKTESTFGGGYAWGGLNQGLYLPFNTIIQTGLAPIATGATNLFGLNPFTDNTALNINTGVVTQQGSGGLNGYFGVINAQNNVNQGGENVNRLTRILDASITNKPSKTASGNIDLVPDESTILRYGGGPKSVLGIGKTNIPFVDGLQRTGRKNVKLSPGTDFYPVTNDKNSSPFSETYNPGAGTYSVFKRPSTSNRNFDQNAAIGASSTFAIDTNAYVNRFSNGVLSGFTGKIDGDITSPTYGQVTKDTGTVNSQDLTEPNRVGAPNISVASNNYEINKSIIDTKGPTNFNLLNIASPVISEGVYGGLGEPIPVSQISKGNLFISGSGVSGLYANQLNDGSVGANLELMEGLLVTLGSQNYSEQPAGNLYSFNPSVYDPASPSLLSSDNTVIQENRTAVMTQLQLAMQTEVGILSPANPFDFRKTTSLGDFRPSQDNANLRMKEKLKTSKILSLAPNYRTQTQNSRISQGDPGQTAGQLISGAETEIKNVLNYGVDASTLIALDKINAQPLYNASQVNKELATNDSCDFNIVVINNDNSGATNTYIHFRAFIDEFNDNYTAKWDPIQYIGRGEEFHNYKGFGREISMGWTVYAQSKAELMPMYQKLNYLASTLAPDYTNAGFMRGNIVTLTMGGYLYNQPGIIKSIGYGIPQESPWEIAINEEGNRDTSVEQLPHMIKVTGFTFIPIQNFVPAKANSLTNPTQKFISLANSTGKTNYKKYQQYSSDGGVLQST